MPQIKNAAVAAYRAGILKIAETAPEPTRAQLCELAQAGAPRAPDSRRKVAVLVGFFRPRFRVLGDCAGVAGLEFALLAAALAVFIGAAFQHLGHFIGAAVLGIHGAGL
jgi:Flp pilus assembly pilin Flp